MRRSDNWIQTYSGKQVWPTEMAPEDIFLTDIAHALALKCRYGCHCLTFYSVAQHSVLVSEQVPREVALPWPQPAEVGVADLVLLRTERRDLMATPPIPWASDLGYEPLPERITPWTWEESEDRFLARFHELSKERQ